MCLIGSLEVIYDIRFTIYASAAQNLSSLGGKHDMDVGSYLQVISDHAYVSFHEIPTPARKS